jgi:hypothetical protein
MSDLEQCSGVHSSPFKLDEGKGRYEDLPVDLPG